MNERANANVGLKAAIIPVTPLQQNCSLMWDNETRKGAVIDPGSLAGIHVWFPDPWPKTACRRRTSRWWACRWPS